MEGGAHEHTRGQESLSISHLGGQATRGLTSPMGSPPDFRLPSLNHSEDSHLAPTPSRLSEGDTVSGEG